MSDRLQHVALWMMRLALWFMSTWYGTFVICGWASLSSKLPFFQSFSKVDLRKREQILLSLSCSSFVLYRMLFNGLKFMTSLLYFTQVRTLHLPQLRCAGSLFLVNWSHMFHFNLPLLPFVPLSLGIWFSLCGIISKALYFMTCLAYACRKVNCSISLSL